MLVENSQILSAVILGIHKVLMQEYPDLFTIIVPRRPQHGKEIAQVRPHPILLTYNFCLR